MKYQDDEQVCISTTRLIERVNAIFAPEGGCYTIAAIVQKIEANHPGWFEDFSQVAKENLVRRVLEWCEVARLKPGSTMPGHLSITQHTGKLSTSSTWGRAGRRRHHCRFVHALSRTGEGKKT